MYNNGPPGGYPPQQQPQQQFPSNPPYNPSNAPYSAPVQSYDPNVSGGFQSQGYPGVAQASNTPYYPPSPQHSSHYSSNPYPPQNQYNAYPPISPNQFQAPISPSQFQTPNPVSSGQFQGNPYDVNSYTQPQGPYPPAALNTPAGQVPYPPLLPPNQYPPSPLHIQSTTNSGSNIMVPYNPVDSSNHVVGFFSSAPTDPEQDKRYVIHYNKMMGLGTGLEKGSQMSLKGFPTYEINLALIDDIFKGVTQPWNVKYDKAQKIFGPGVTCKVARTTIRTQHDLLYRNSKIRNQEGTIKNGEDLIHLLERGRRGGQVLFYTYVIIGETWRFSQTGASMLKDFFSKHAAHACCSTSVVYSGEFHLQETPLSMKLIIDNNSGTYSPDKNLLPKLQELFQRNFRGLEVEALDYNDPRLKNYVAEAKSNNLLCISGGNIAPQQY